MAFPTQSLTLASASSQFARAVDSASLEISGDMTLEMWIKFTSLPGAGSTIYVANRDPDDNANRVWAISIMNNAGTYVARMYNSSDGTNAGTSPNATINTSGLTTGTWFHIAWVYTAASQKLEFFIDGVSQGTNTGTLNSSMYTGGDSPFTLGAYDTGVSNFTNGQLSLVRLWSSARTSTQLTDNWCTILGATANMVAEWTLDNTYNDNSGNSNTLTGFNSPTFSADVTASCILGPTGVKTFDGVTQSTGIKTYFGVTTGSVKTVNGIA